MRRAKVVRARSVDEIKDARKDSTDKFVLI